VLLLDLKAFSVSRNEIVEALLAENIGAADCSIPSGNIHWRTTRQPVVLDDWPARIAVGFAVNDVILGCCTTTVTVTDLVAGAVPVAPLAVSV